MSITRHGRQAALLLPILALVGCSAQTFDQINQAFTQTKGFTQVAQNSALPAAAMATNITVVELVKAISADTQSKMKSGALGNVIAAGGGNVISAGGGNVISAGGGNLTAGSAGFAPNFHVMTTSTDSAPTSSYNLDDSTKTGSLKTTQDGKTIVDVTFNYDRSTQPGQVHYAITNLKGTASGYTIAAQGRYDMTNAANANGQVTGTVDCSVSGSLKTATDNLSLDKLSFHVQVPMPDSVPNLGELQLTDNGNVISATASIVNRKVTAQATLTDKTGKQTDLTLDQNGFSMKNASGTASAAQ